MGLFASYHVRRKGIPKTMGLPSLPLTWWAGKVGGSTDIGDYQIAHLPPLAASAGAASWAAEYKKIRAATKRIL